MAGLWDTVKTLWNLSERVEEIEAHQRAIEDEWSDVQTKLSTLVARLAKQQKRQLQETLDHVSQPAHPDTPTAASHGLSHGKIEMWRRFHAKRAASNGETQ